MKTFNCIVRILCTGITRTGIKIESTTQTDIDVKIPESALADGSGLEYVRKHYPEVNTAEDLMFGKPGEHYTGVKFPGMVRPETISQKAYLLIPNGIEQGAEAYALA
jgi:hypothetical protein